MTHASLEEQLQGSIGKIGIPPRPVILDHIRAEMDKDEPDFNHLSELITADVALSASLVSITNSPFFGFRGHVNSPRAALMILGLNTAGKAIAGIVMRRTFPSSPHLERFWDASARIARLSGWLAPRLTRNALRPDDAYTFGLFRDCGIPILLSRFPHYFEVLDRANHDDEQRFTAIEELTLPTNHAVIGYMLAQSWWLTDETSAAIRLHHDLDSLNASTIPPTLTSRHLIAVSQLAEYLLQCHSGLSHTREWDKLGASCLRLLNLEEEDIETLLDEARSVIEADN